KKGHIGNGRSSISEKQADDVIEVDCEEKVCPNCAANLEGMGSRDRSVLDIDPPKIKKVVYKLKRSRCPKCGCNFRAKPPGVLPKFLFSNKLLAYLASEHYLHNRTMGKLEKLTGINKGSLIDGMHHLGKVFDRVPEKLINSYRQSLVKHADETSWRNDGQNGYAWLFCTSDISIFRLRKSRSSKVPKEVFGNKDLPGVLVVDRYNGYNKSPCKIQYCYAHLLRNVQDLTKEFPNNSEIQSFVETVAPLLSKAMGLRSKDIADDEFKKRTKKLKSSITNTMNKEANHPGIQKIQNIFRENKHRLYHWSNERRIPADNNFCERELRQLVIARKISFGSQSDEGAKTREILMTVLLTLQKQYPENPMEIFKKCLDEIKSNPDKDVYKIFFPYDTS
ncbi:hypothetical protein LCGC14_2641230, partial [marine sediment metagenome]